MKLAEILPIMSSVQSVIISNYHKCLYAGSKFYVPDELLNCYVCSVYYSKHYKNNVIYVQKDPKNA